MMNLRRMICVTLVLTFGVRGFGADDVPRAGESVNVASEASPVPRSPSQVVEQALTFLVQDTAKWRKERGCATCHHGTMTLWSLGEARDQGYTVDAEVYADTLKWTKDLFLPRFSKPRDTRPGWDLVSVPAIYLGIMSQNLPVLSRAEINQIAIHLASHQEEDGAWSLPPPKNGAPPTWESRETLAILALLGWETRQPADPQAAAAASQSREKALAWLRSTPPTETTQATTLRLLLELRTSGKSPDQLQPEIGRLLKRQNADGGWNQTPEQSSDGYATGQALYVLSEAGLKPDRPEIRRAIAFLVATQQPDGSWPMTSRNHPGVESTRKPIRNPIPITYFGSAWATLGLVRFVPSAPDTPARQQQAFDRIQSFHGKFEVDEQQPGKPVVRVDLRYYEVSDDELANFAQVLKAFPRLATLEFKSPKITDAGLVPLFKLSQLKNLTLENTALTDAGLAQLQVFTQLEKLNLKGTKVTDAGVTAIQQQLPQLKVER